MKFERVKGLPGVSAQNWIDSSLPRCPLCKMPSLWEVGLGMKLSSYSNRSRAYDRYYFRCSRCMAVLSIAVAAVDGAAFGLGLIGLVVKRIMGKDLKVESVGSNQNLQHLVGAHYPLEVLQKWASR